MVVRLSGIASPSYLIRVTHTVCFSLLLVVLTVKARSLLTFSTGRANCIDLP